MHDHNFKLKMWVHSQTGIMNMSLKTKSITTIRLDQRLSHWFTCWRPHPKPPPRRKHKVVVDENDRMEGRYRQGGVNSRSGRDDRADMHECTGQSGRGQPIRGRRCESTHTHTHSCERSGGRTGLEVERLSQIKTWVYRSTGSSICVWSIDQHKTDVINSSRRFPVTPPLSFFGVSAHLCLYLCFNHFKAELNAKH